MLASFYTGPIQFGPLNSVPIDLMSPRNAIDLTATITTPENIQFEYRIAGPFRRIPAFLVDLLVRIVAFLAIFVAVACSGITQLFPFLSQFATIGVVILLTYFFIDWFYGVFFETYWNGRTIGKWISKIQVISVDGRPISAYQATIRNFLRLADLAPMMSLAAIFANEAPPFLFPTGLVAILCMVFTTRFQRLGDLAAGTMVVVDERAWVPPKVKLEDPRVASLSELIPANFMMSRSMVRAVALYAERRMRMPMARRMELSARIPVLIFFSAPCITGNLLPSRLRSPIVGPPTLAFQSPKQHRSWTLQDQIPFRTYLPQHHHQISQLAHHSLMESIHENG